MKETCAERNNKKIVARLVMSSLNRKPSLRLSAFAANAFGLRETAFIDLCIANAKFGINKKFTGWTLFGKLVGAAALRLHCSLRDLDTVTAEVLCLLEVAVSLKRFQKLSTARKVLVPGVASTFATSTFDRIYKAAVGIFSSGSLDALDPALLKELAALDQCGADEGTFRSVPIRGMSGNTPGAPSPATTTSPSTRLGGGRTLCTTGEGGGTMEHGGCTLVEPRNAFVPGMFGTAVPRAASLPATHQVEKSDCSSSDEILNSISQVMALRNETEAVRLLTAATVTRQVIRAATGAAASSAAPAVSLSIPVLLLADTPYASALSVYDAELAKLWMAHNDLLTSQLAPLKGRGACAHPSPPPSSSQRANVAPKLLPLPSPLDAAPAALIFPPVPPSSTAIPAAIPPPDSPILVFEAVSPYKLNRML